MFINLNYIILVLPAIIFSIWANKKVNSTFQKYQTQFSSRNITGAQAARYVLDRNGLTHIRIRQLQAI